MKIKRRKGTFLLWQFYQQVTFTTQQLLFYLERQIEQSRALYLLLPQITT